jgi:predicted short-subunit dehydrogenase-like oxidoreductase (DUF2520 family)
MSSRQFLAQRTIRSAAKSGISSVELERKVSITTPNTSSRTQPARPCPSSLDACRIGVLGAGRVGTSLAIAWRRAGVHVLGLTDVREQALERADWEFDLPTLASARGLVNAGVNVFCLAVPDALLPAAADELGGLLSGLTPEEVAATAVLHTSGATPLSSLESCADAGAVTLSLHPLQSFSDPFSGSRRLEGAAIAITPGPRGGWELGELLGSAVGGRPFFLKEEDRVLYHAAACIASNYLVTLEHVAEVLFRRAGLPSEGALEAFLPLVQGAVDNMKQRGTVAALTGPLSRGDTSTVAAHLDELAAKATDHLSLYRILGLATLDLIRQRGELPPEVILNMGALLSGSTSPVAESDRSVRPPKGNRTQPRPPRRQR